MPDENSPKYKSALDAIETVSEKGLKGEEFTWRRIWPGALIVFFALSTCVLSIMWFIQHIALKDQPTPPELEPLANPPVLVVLPKSDAASVKENADRQEEGFEKAYVKKGVSLDGENRDLLFNYFKYPVPDPRKEPTERGLLKQEIMDRFDMRYEDGFRIFIVTMSGTAYAIKDDFIRWASEKPENDRPVLIATVASRPELADRQAGVFRHYVRSEDESEILATYIASVGVEVVGIFYVDDEYGRSAKENLKEQLRCLASNIECLPYDLKISASVEDAKPKVLEFLRRTDDSESAVAVVIGYADMFKNTIEALIGDRSEDGNEAFKGEILAVSTFTELGWLTDTITTDALENRRIRFVGPGSHQDRYEENGVVYQFSFLTLYRALSCANLNREQELRGAEAFWDCWSGNDIKPADDNTEEWATVDFMANGDSRVKLHLYRAEDWLK